MEQSEIECEIKFLSKQNPCIYPTSLKRDGHTSDRDGWLWKPGVLYYRAINSHNVDYVFISKRISGATFIQFAAFVYIFYSKTLI